MSNISESAVPRAAMPRAAALAGRANALLAGIPASLYTLMMRVAIFLVFFQSARTKVEGLLMIKESTFFLFQYEYALPLLPPHLAAYMATYSEHFFSLLILLGLATRFAALPLLGMTLVIQIFVYPEAYTVHLSWAAMLVALAALGGGRFSLDHLLFRR